jgi:hypothetical protein
LWLVGVGVEVETVVAVAAVQEGLELVLDLLFPLERITQLQLVEAVQGVLLLGVLTAIQLLLVDQLPLPQALRFRHQELLNPLVVVEAHLPEVLVKQHKTVALAVAVIMT